MNRCVVRRRIKTIVGALALLILVLAAGFGVVSAQDRRGAAPKATHELWFFFGPEQDLAQDVRAMREFLRRHPHVALRPCLLVEDFAAIERPAAQFTNTLKELRSLATLADGLDLALRIVDDDGLLVARALGVEALPAYALIGPMDRQGSRAAHVGQGKGAKLEELVKCR